MTFPKFESVAIYALVIVSMWSPAPDSPLGSLGEPIRYALFAGISLTLIAYTYFARRIRISLSADWALLIAFLLYTALSALWGDGGANGMIKAVLILFTLTVSICIVNLKRLDELLVVFYTLACVFVVVSLIIVVLFPAQGIETGWELEGDWKGLAAQKNELGAISAFVVVGALALPVGLGRLAMPIRLINIAIAMVCLINSGSRGGQLIAIVGVASLICSRLPKTLQRLILIALVVFSVPLIQLVLSTISLTDDKIGVLGTTLNTSNRTTLWFYGLDQLQSHLLLGFGVGGFWTPARLIAFNDLHGWVLDNFHNGYITILIEGGLIGLLLMLTAIGFILLLLLVSVGHLRDAYLSVAFAFTMMFLISNLVENQIGRSTSSFFLMFLVISLAIHGHVKWLARLPAKMTPHPTPIPGRRAIAQRA
ncbi:MAG: O-antigen ligase family protein [Mesorhizobium sp.]